MQPFFITGVPRSGTTLLSVVLNNHRALYVGPSAVARRFVRLEELFLRDFGTSGDIRAHTPEAWFRRALEADARLWKLCRKSLHRMDHGVPAVVAHAARREAGRHGKRVWGSKGIDLMEEAPALLRYFRGARFVHIVRDPRAVAASQQRRQYVHPYLAAHHWKRALMAALWQGRLLGPERYMEVRYEDLLRTPGAVLGRVCAFLGVEYDQEMTRLEKAEATSAPNAYVRDRFDTSRIGRWRDELPPKDVVRLERIAGDWMQRLGYELEQASPDGPFDTLSPLAVKYYRQAGIWRKFRARDREVMRRQRLEREVRPLRERLKRLVASSMNNVLHPDIVRHFWRQRPIV